jgi:hypothetical protein
LAHHAQPGGILSIWGTGLNGGRVAGSIGGAGLEVLYVGPAPAMRGVDQLNLRLPLALPEGCYTGLKLSVEGESANPVTVTTGTGPCSHPLAFSAEQLARIDAGDRVAIASIEVNSFTGPVRSNLPQWESISRMEGATARITPIDLRECSWHNPTRRRSMRGRRRVWTCT